MNNNYCRVQNLAEEGPARIGYCQHCQVFHVQFGYTTLHIEPEAFFNLGATFNTALAVIKRQKECAEEERTKAKPEIKNALH